MCAGRPFFMRIGVSHASAAPALSSAARTSGHSRGSRSSTLVSSTQAPDSAVEEVEEEGDVAAPTSSRVTLACVAGSRPPAPTPTALTVIGGCGPYDDASPVRSAAPVGVQDSWLPGPARDGTPRSSSATAGTGTGRLPWVPWTRPEPTATGETTTEESPRWANPAQTPTTSAIASRAPTSWKCTCSTGIPCAVASAEASRPKTWTAIDRTAAGSGAASRSARSSGQPRRVLESGTSTWQRVAASPPRRSWDTESRTGSGLTAETASERSASGTPAPSRAPSSMSPEAPAVASTQPITTPRGATGGRPSRRRRLRRTRCRC